VGLEVVWVSFWALMLMCGPPQTQGVEVWGCSSGGLQDWVTPRNGALQRCAQTHAVTHLERTHLQLNTHHRKPPPSPQPPTHSPASLSLRLLCI
jgi:hypothetical protein